MYCSGSAGKNKEGNPEDEDRIRKSTDSGPVFWVSSGR